MRESDVVIPIKVFSGDEAKSAKTVDGFDNFISRLGLNNDNMLSAGLYVFNLMTRNRIQLEAGYRGSWIVGQVIDTVAEDMTKAGIDIITTKGDEKIPKVMSSFTRLGIWSSLREGIQWGRLYGGGLAVLQIEGQDLSTPLDIATVGKGQFQGITIYDRWQLNPVLDKIIPTGPEIGLPMFYDVTTTSTSVSPMASTTGQLKIHHSRCIRMIGIQLPYFQAITEMMWGESILERLWDRLISFDSATMSSANLIERANNRTIGIENYREIISAGGMAQKGLEAQFEAMRQFQSNEGLTIIDKNDTFATTQYTFAGLSDLILQFGQQLAGASNIPLVRLFGQSPAGLNATGESDMRMYYDNINAQQEARLRRGMTVILHVMWRSLFGEAAPDDIDFEFVPLWQMSASDKATNGKTITETVLGAHEGGLISTATAMKELRQASGDTGLFSNITDEDIDEAEELNDNPPAPGEADPNAPPAATDKQSAFQRIKAWVLGKAA